MPISPEEFRSTLARFASGVTVVTSRDDAGRFHGITVSAFCSVSLDPPLILVCIEKPTGSHEALMKTGLFAVNFLSDGQSELSEHFASQAADKLSGIEHRIGANGTPVLSGCIANLECRVMQKIEAGDHTVFIGQVESALQSGGEPLIYFRGAYHRLVS